MKKSKLITLLSTFSKEEMKRFEKFSSSGYHNKGRNFKPFLTILKRYYPLFDNPNLTSEKIYIKLNPGKNYDHNAALTMRVLESQLTSIAEKFIVFESLNEKDNFIFTKILSEKLLDRKLFSNAMNTGLKASELLDSSERKIGYFDERLQMNELIATIFIKKRSGSKRYDFNEKNTLLLFAMFFDRLSKLSINLIGDSRLHNAPHPEINSLLKIINNFDPVLFEKEHTDDDSGSKEFVIMNYHLCKTRLDYNDTDSFEFALQYYYKHFNSFSNFYKWAFFLRLHNFGNTKAMDINYPLYGLKLHKLSEFILKKNHYSHNKDDYLDEMGCINIFWFKFAFLNPGDLKKFINKIIKKIDPHYYIDKLEYMNTFLYFKEKQFNKVLSSLSKLNSAFPGSKNLIHMLKLASLFECSYFEEAIMEMDSYDHFLRKNKNVHAMAKSRGLKFKDAVLTFINIKTKTNYENNDLVLDKIISGEFRGHLYFWLLEKAEEFKSSKK